MIEILSDPKNNLLQSALWAEFQKRVGKKALKISDFLALDTPIINGKSFYWIQRSPQNLGALKKLELPSSVVFLRIEPFEVSEKEIKKLGLKKVERKSLLGGQKSPKATRIISLSGSLEEVLSQMKPKTRYNIRLAEKKGVNVRISQEPQDATILYNMLEKTAERGKGYHHFEKKYYQEMMEVLAPQGNLFLLIAEHEGSPVAAVLVSVFGKVATYLHGGFNEQSRSLMAPFLLQYEAMKLARDKGCVLYDLWGVAETDDPKDTWAGITRFKEGFGGEKIIFPGAYDLVFNPFWYNFLSMLAKARRVIKR